MENRRESDRLSAKTTVGKEELFQVEVACRHNGNWKKLEMGKSKRHRRQEMRAEYKEEIDERERKREREGGFRGMG